MMEVITLFRGILYLVNSRTGSIVENEHMKLAFFQHMIAHLVITIELTVKNVCALKRQPSVRDAQIRRRHHVNTYVYIN